MREIVVLQHAECETLGSIAAALAAAGLSARVVRSFDGEPVPQELERESGLVLMGGPMGVCDQLRYPFLSDEMRLIEQAMRRGVPVLGVCLGSQLLASALGAPVMKGPKKEIGWHTVRLAAEAQADPLWSGAPAEFTALHWHGDVFRLPAGAVRLASSDLTECQAFRSGNKSYGILFHMEATRTMIETWIGAFSQELAAEKIDGHRLLAEEPQHRAAIDRLSGRVFGAWARMALS